MVDRSSVQVAGNRISDDGEVARRWAVAGQGIAHKSALDATEDLAAGRLGSTCAQWTGEPVPLNLLCADRRQISPVVKAPAGIPPERCKRVLAVLEGIEPG